MTPTELASLEALAKAEPVAWISDQGIDLVAMPKTMSVRAIVQNRPDAEYSTALYTSNPAAILSLIEENKRMREALEAIVDCYGVGYKTEAQFCEAVRPLIADARAALEPQS